MYFQVYGYRTLLINDAVPLAAGPSLAPGLRCGDAGSARSQPTHEDSLRTQHETSRTATFGERLDRWMGRMDVTLPFAYITIDFHAVTTSFCYKNE